MLKNIVNGFKGIVEVASANINPYNVQVIKLEDYRSFLVQSQDGVLILYKRHGCYECVLTSICATQKSYSIFRLSGDGHALAQFKIYSEKLNPIASASSSIYQEDILKKVCDCIQQHQTWTPAHVAAFVGLYECFKQPEFVSNLNSTCGTSNSVPLMAAVLGKQLRCLQELLNAGAVLAQYDKAGVINWLNNKGQTALYLACEKNESDAVEALLKAKADPNVTACGRYPIHIAVKTENMKSVKLILERFKDQAHALDEKNGGTPVHWARNKEMIELLYRMGSNLNLQSKTGHTPLHIMLEKSRRDCTMELLCFGADSCISDYDGNTPLHHAVMKDNVEMTRVFVVFGADVDMLNNKGQSARHIASTTKSKNGAKGCCKGCMTEGTWNGTDDPAMNTVLETDKDAYKVLCLDGGGIRGLVLVQMLIAIEKYAGKPIVKCFDWIAGTSTGGLLALGIARGK
ncbi:hypothetical protein KUTeg_001223 [Tegillarca granosa]|uniref:phospholipase A2 n=1 Tax=Tegillarca granosa TaxID=220873 RepID=A0ABQ9FZU6_TEGGR|nr:hypothetical protein KUTeg_001223 [Tegillarca granosa]